jgi:hypothetical protein
MRRCPDLAIEGVDNFNIDETDDAHALFSAEDEEYSKETDPDAELQECGFAQKGRSKPTGVRGLLDPCDYKCRVRARDAAECLAPEYNLVIGDYN